MPWSRRVSARMTTSDRLRLVAPDLNSGRARLADWLELQALTNARQSASVSNIRSQVRRQGDARALATEADAEADDEGEPEITDRLSDDLEEKLFDELSFRITTIGDAYPFELISDPGRPSQLLRRRATWADAQTGELIYVFCLLDSGIRDGLIDCPASAQPLVQNIGNIFQICCCIAVGGYTNAEVVSFGFPRKTGTGFLPALQDAWCRYGSYNIIAHIPFGFDDRLKDGGVDIIAWRHFADRFAATLIMFVQVASGLGWKDKEVSGDVRALRQWFDGPSFYHFLPAICIPFPLWFDLDEAPEGRGARRVAFSEGVKNRFVARESKFGIIFDRGRIAQSSSKALAAHATNSLTHPVDGIDRICDVATWVDEAMSKLVEVRSHQ